MGRQIIHVDFRRGFDGHQWHTAPVLTLDNGRRVWFSTSEYSDGSDYGVNMLVSDRPKKAVPGE